MYQNVLVTVLLLVVTINKINGCIITYNSLLVVFVFYNPSGDENHLRGANLRQSHKISLKAYRHAHGVGSYPNSYACEATATVKVSSVVRSCAHGAIWAHVHDNHCLTRSKINSLLTEMITPQTYIQVLCRA